MACAQQPVVKHTEKGPKYDLVSADYGPVECGKEPKLVKHISIVPEWCKVQKVGELSACCYERTWPSEALEIVRGAFAPKRYRLTANQRGRIVGL